MFAIGSTSMLVGLWLFALLFGIGVFFFVFTRGTLLLRAWSGASQGPTSHVYPVYSEMWLIKLVDFQPIISAILLFQYGKLVDRIVAELKRTVLSGKKVLITSCAFGNIIPSVVRASADRNAKCVVITDIVKNELTRAGEKLSEFADRIELSEENATHMKQADGSVEANVMFFLLHELPDHLKEMALNEAGRVVASGGKLILAEFHRPDPFFFRMLSSLYFRVFEPHGLALWDGSDPVWFLEDSGLWTCERTTYCLGNFQVIVATKK